MRTGLFTLLIAVLFACNTDTKNDQEKAKKNAGANRSEEPMTLDLKQAERIVGLPLGCIDTEYPNLLHQVLGGNDDLRPPSSLHPAFYGCFDWHSAVHGHWSLVRLLRTFPELKEREEIIAGLKNHLSKENIAGELAYFDDPLSQGFERMYGWAWLLKLSEELHRWDAPEARELETNLEPLTKFIVSEVIDFLPDLQYPIRVGTHTNTAFALGMVYDYAVATKNEKLKTIVSTTAKNYYQNDKNCPLTWEPSGYDFLSPCLEEANLMRKILSKKEFEVWLNEFLPDLMNPNFKLKPGIVTNREDGHLVHLDGLNYSRAWCLFGIAETLPHLDHLVPIANDHLKHSLPDLTDGNYEGGHWLASFALMALTH